jgi:hypothetical protein
MTDIHTSIDIDASPEAVWAILTDTATYPEWNPHLVRAEGGLAAGERLPLTVRQSGRESTLTVRVTEYDEPRRLAWVGRFVAPFLFEGTHAFELEPLDGGDRTRLHNTEASRGLLVPLVVRSDAREAYEAMNAALKRRVELDRGDAAADGRPAIVRVA